MACYCNKKKKMYDSAFRQSDWTHLAKGTGHTFDRRHETHI